MAWESTFRRLDAFFQHEVSDKLKAIYDVSRFPTRKELAAFCDGQESMELSELSSEIFFETYKVAMEGLHEDIKALGDGAPKLYPELIWSTHIGNQLKHPVLESLRPYSIPEEETPARGNSPQAGAWSPANMAAGGTMALGAGAVATSLVMTPLQVWLLALGIVAVAGGAVILLTYSGHCLAGNPSQGTADDPARQAQTIRRVIHTQYYANLNNIKTWMDQVKRLIEEGMNKEMAGGA